jgi:hypothetical protein
MKYKLFFKDKLSPVSTIVLFLYTNLLFLPFSRLGVDLHHDGIMFTSAMLVRHGKSVQSEVYNHYGPVSNWLQSIELAIFGDYLIVIRIFSSIVLSLSVTINYVAAKRYFGKTIAFCASVIWVACAPFFDSDFQMLPWSSDYLLLSNSVAILLATSISIKKSGKDRNTFLIGAILGINLFIKIHPSVPILVAVVVCSGLFVGVDQTRRLVQGSVTSVSTIFVLLLFFGSPEEWWLQAVSMSGQMYEHQFQSGLDGLKANILVNGVTAIFGAYFCIWVVVNLRRIFQPEEKRNEFVRILRIIAVSLLTWIFFSEMQLTVLNPRLFLWAAVLGMILYAAKLVPNLNSVEDHRKFPIIVYLAIAAGSLLQVFPVLDRMHLWWATLPALAMVLDRIFSQKSRNTKNFSVALLCVALVIPALDNAYTKLNVKREKVNSSEQLSGMLVSKDFNAAFGGYIDLVEQFQNIHGDKSILGLCRDGLFTSFGRSLSQPDPYFVYWQFPKPVYDNDARQVFIQEHRPMLWICWPYVDYEPTLANYGYRLVHRPSCLNDIERFNSFELSGSLAIPNEWPMIQTESLLRKLDVCAEL